MSLSAALTLGEACDKINSKKLQKKVIKLAEALLVEATEKEKATLYNLLEKYLYEFSQWEKTDVDDRRG